MAEARLLAPRRRGGATRLPLIDAPVFVGRERELAALGEALIRPPAVIFLEGEAGVGKSRLLQVYLASLAGQQQRPLVVACPPLREPCTLGPVVDALRQATDGVGSLRLSGLAGALRPLFPEWAAELPPAPEPVEDATAARHRLFSALVELLGRLEVALLVVEDVHWADDATLEFLLFLASRQPQTVSLVLTYRPEDVETGSLLLRLSSRLCAGATQVRIGLGPLDVAETAGLVSSMLSGEHVSEQFARFLHQRTEGIPLALEELVRLLYERDDLYRRGGGWVRRHLDAIEVPPTIRDAVAERTGRLGPAARALLQAAAVLTDPAEEATLIAVSGLPHAQVAEGFSEAFDSGLLREDGRGRLCFRHMLAGRAVYESIAVPERRALHRRAGRTLEGRSPLPLARLASHFREAGDSAKWSEYAERAADLALAAGDEASAGALLHGLVTEAGGPVQSVARLTNKMVLLSFTEDSRLRDLVRVLRDVLADERVEAGQAAQLRFQLGRILLVLGEVDAARGELERAVPNLPRGSLEATRAMMLLAWPQGSAWTASRHLEWLRRAAEVGRRLPPAERLRLAVDRVTVLLALGDEEGWAEVAQLPDGEPAPWQRLQLTRAHCNIGEAAMLWGRYGDARRHLSRALDLADSHGYLRLRNLVLANQAHLRWFSGAWDGLAEETRRLAEGEDVEPIAQLDAALVSGLLLEASGERVRAEEPLQLALDETLQRGAVEYSFEPAAALARLLLAAGRVEEALQITDRPVKIMSLKGIWLRATEIAPARVAALLAAGRNEEATAFVTAFAAGLRGCNAQAPSAALRLCGAVLAESRDRHVRAASLFGRTAAAWQALPRPYEALLARERQGGCLLAAGQRDQGLALLAETFRGLCELGASGDAERVKRTLDQHGVRVRRPSGGGRPSYGDRLSPRELEVVCLLVDGRTNRQIAEQLVVSPSTVASHLRAAMGKLRVSSRTALAVRALELDNVGGDDSVLPHAAAPKIDWEEQIHR